MFTKVKKKAKAIRLEIWSEDKHERPRD